ncbi:methyltransferase [Denitrificimonas caeni]|uniref:Ribosomal RNA large subunit methyltransferase G n=1 Tax=Denitrificimonas caeni TaxID=521720 RepID=A0AAE9VMR0_9GAMM|nr:methyltransferase [Denitrificimonas caeni]WBE25028.1 methyltransferase [Denitrificimonas caeni]
MPILNTAYAQLDLKRYPEQHNSPLQAFDAADEYLLKHLSELSLSGHSRCLILNDNFGALAISLAEHMQVHSSGDSFLAHQALRNNLDHNQRPADAVQILQSEQAFQGPYDCVLIRVPKTLALLEEQLIRLQSHISDRTIIVAAGMIKHLPRSAGDLLERYIGPVQASLAEKKARLLFVTPTNIAQAQSPYPSSYELDKPKISLRNHAGVFCREALDIGTRFLLPHLPSGLGHAHVADLGCGNGVMAIVCALENPEAQLLLVDESYMAVQSAQENWQQALGQRPVTIYAGDGLGAVQPQTLDVVLCNPPFHQQQVVGDFLARRMLQQSHRALKPGGQLWVVGNRHLGYHITLKRMFSKVEQVAANAKFVIFKASK